MKTIRNFIDFLVKCSFFVGLSFFCLVVISFVASQRTTNYNYAFAVFCGSILTYNYFKYADLVFYRKFISQKLIAITAVSVFAMLGFFYCYEKMSNVVKVELLLCGFLVLLYPKLRKNAFTKICFVAVCVAVVTVIIPLLLSKVAVNLICIEFLQRLTYLCSAIIPFDILDSTSDSLNVNTIVQKYGTQFSKNVGYFCAVLFVLLELIKNNPSQSVFIVAMLLCVFLKYAKANRSKLYTLLWLESIPVVWLIVLLLFSSIF